MEDPFFVAHQKTDSLLSTRPHTLHCLCSNNADACSYFKMTGTIAARCSLCIPRKGRMKISANDNAGHEQALVDHRPHTST